MKTSFMFVVILMLSQSLLAETNSVDLFEQKTNFSKKLFSLEINTSDAAGTTTITSSFKDPSGAVAMEERGVFKKDELISFDVDQKQTLEKARIEVQGDQVLFTYEKEGKKKSASEKLQKPLLTTANFNAFILNHWDEVATEKGLDIRYAVWFRLETVGFKVFKVGEVQKVGQRWIHLRMKPSSFLIAALVDPLDLWYDSTSKRMMEMSGRVSPKQLVQGTYKDLDCDVRYNY